jgi:hypothetical protein
MIGWLIFIGILASPFVWYRFYVKLPRGYRLHVKLARSSYEPYRWTLVREGPNEDIEVMTGKAEFMIWVRLVAARRARQDRRFG